MLNSFIPPITSSSSPFVSSSSPFASSSSPLTYSFYNDDYSVVGYFFIYGYNMKYMSSVVHGPE